MTGDDLMAAHTQALLLTATTAAIVGSARVGLLEAILTEPRTADELSAALGLHADATARVLVLLTSIGVIERDDEGRFQPAPPLAAEAKGPSGGPENSLKMWSRIDEYLRTGRSLLDTIPSEQPRGRAYSAAVSGLGRIFRRLSEHLATALGEVHGAKRILDVGAGSGQWSLAMAARDPEVRITALDLPPVLPRFEDNAGRYGLQDRVDTIAGDYHDVELPAGTFDRIVAANVLHLESETDAEALVRRLVPALAPGGKLVVVDALPPAGSETDPKLAAYALSLGLRTGQGRPHPEASHRAWISAAGLSSIARVDAGGTESLVAALVGSRGDEKNFLRQPS